MKVSCFFFTMSNLILSVSFSDGSTDADERSCTDFNRDSIHKLISAGLDIDKVDSTCAIEEALGALGANFNVDFRHGFHALRSLMPANHSMEGWVNDWHGRAVTEVVTHQLASLNSVSSSGGKQAVTSIGDTPLLFKSGALVRAFSYEEDKYSLVSHLSSWLALSALWHFYHWMVSKTGCSALSKNTYNVVSNCSRTPCVCHRHGHPFNLLCECAGSLGQQSEGCQHQHSVRSRHSPHHQLSPSTKQRHPYRHSNLRSQKGS
jgi:hypothetical protein